MNFLHRLAIVVRAKTRYVEWANSVRGDAPELTIEQVRTNPAVYLLAPVLGDSEAPEPRDVLAAGVPELFEAELERWTDDEEKWPANRTAAVFHAWFDVEIVDHVVDVDDDLPIGPMSEEEAVRAALEHCAWCGGHLDPDAVRLVTYEASAEEIASGARALYVDLDENSPGEHGHDHDHSHAHDHDHDHEDDERLAIAVRASEFVRVRDDEPEGAETRASGDHGETADAADDLDFVLACCSDECREQIETRLGYAGA